MSQQKIELFDTTLRDGTQGEHVSVSVTDKLRIAERLDDFGINIIEGGWPGSNPKDVEFFARAKNLKLRQAKICAFGSTARDVSKVQSDVNLNALLKAETEVVSIFGKSWKLHSKLCLNLEEEQNADLIYQSVSFLTTHGRRVIFDAEHFFDGYKDHPEFALNMLKAAESAGASVLVLCDTNGGALPNEVGEIVQFVKKGTNIPLGIHAHNDGEMAVANSFQAVLNGVRHIQGTINGIGERCGNVNLCSVIPNLVLKSGFETVTPIQLDQLSFISHFVSETMNFAPFHRQPFVGKSAFAHKGGIHVSAVMKESRLYEHIQPEIVGNRQRVLVSELAGQSNIVYKSKELGVDLSEDKTLAASVVARIKQLEHKGYQFDGAEASFELILRSEQGAYRPFFRLDDFKVVVVHTDELESTAEAVLKVEVDGLIEHTVAEGNGPINALDLALRKGLMRFYPELQSVRLSDYKVRVLNETDGTEANVRVLIESTDGEKNWTTVGVSQNIIEASLQALSDSLNYHLFNQKPQPVSVTQSVTSGLS